MKPDLTLVKEVLKEIDSQLLEGRNIYLVRDNQILVLFGDLLQGYIEKEENNG